MEPVGTPTRALRLAATATASALVATLTVARQAALPVAVLSAAAERSTTLRPSLAATVELARVATRRVVTPELVVLQGLDVGFNLLAYNLVHLSLTLFPSLRDGLHSSTTVWPEQTQYQLCL